MRGAWLTLLSGVVLCALPGCKTGGESGFGVALTLIADPSLSATTIKSVKQLEISASGDENESEQYSFTHSAFAGGKETVVYRPLASSHQIVLDVILRDGSGAVVGEGGTGSIVLRAGQLLPVAVHISPGGAGPAGDLSVGDMAVGDGNVGPGGDGGSGAVALAVDKTSFDFGTVVQGTTSAQTTFTISNGGSAASGMLAAKFAGSDAAAFALLADQCSGHALAPQASCTISVTVQPTSTGSMSATLTVGDPTGDSVGVGFSATAVAPGALSIVPVQQDFGAVLVAATSSDLSFTVSNGGGASTGTLTAALSGSDGTQFSITSDGCSTKKLMPSASCVIQVHFAPQSAGFKSASLTVSGTPGGVAAANLSGTALSPAVLTLTPPTQSFGAVVQNDNSSDITFTVGNSGGGDSGPVAISLTGSNASEFSFVQGNCNAKIVGGGSCSFTVRFSPTSAGAGKTATLQVNATPGGGASAQLSGDGLAPAALA
ncbi:MAG TPA: choice-of-anchor D domain-containing protein, partial [Polyangia bacterium]|nr:choice-of-anchor D domain-containing protein [Polyangia bacterium]